MTPDYPYIELQPEDERITVSNAALRLLGKPRGIHFLWNASKRSLVIELADADDPDMIEVEPEIYKQNAPFITHSFILTTKIFNDLDNAFEFCFRIVAKYNEPSNILIFDMEKATKHKILNY